MRRDQLVECADCLQVDTPTKNGRCSTCSSLAITWVSNLHEGVRLMPSAQHQPQRLCGIDREFLREMGVSA